MRTKIMHQKLRSHGLQFKIENDKYYLQINGKEVLILDGTVTDFINVPMACVGANVTNREIVFFDPKSKYLADQAQLLKNKIAHIRREKARKLTVKEILDITIIFIRSILKCNEKSVLALYGSWAGKREQNIPIIPLDEFIKRGFGVCRHYSLFASFLLDSLIKDRILDHGIIHYQRHNIPSGGVHVWVIYEPFSLMRQDAYLIDSLWNEQAYLINADNSKLYIKYGISLILCQSKFTDASKDRIHQSQHIHKHKDILIPKHEHKDECKLMRIKTAIAENDVLMSLDEKEIIKENDGFIPLDEKEIIASRPINKQCLENPKIIFDSKQIFDSEITIDLGVLSNASEQEVIFLTNIFAVLKTFDLAAFGESKAKENINKNKIIDSRSPMLEKVLVFSQEEKQFGTLAINDQNLDSRDIKNPILPAFLLLLRLLCDDIKPFNLKDSQILSILNKLGLFRDKLRLNPVKIDILGDNIYPKQTFLGC